MRLNLLSLAGPLASSGVSIFVVSTYDTDYLLVPERDLERAVDALARTGHDARPAEPGSFTRPSCRPGE